MRNTKRVGDKERAKKERELYVIVKCKEEGEEEHGLVSLETGYLPNHYIMRA